MKDYDIKYLDEPRDYYTYFSSLGAELALAADRLTALISTDSAGSSVAASISFPVDRL